MAVDDQSDLQQKIWSAHTEKLKNQLQISNLFYIVLSCVLSRLFVKVIYVCMWACAMLSWSFDYVGLPHLVLLWITYLILDSHHCHDLCGQMHKTWIYISESLKLCHSKILPQQISAVVLWALRCLDLGMANPNPHIPGWHCIGVDREI